MLFWCCVYLLVLEKVLAKTDSYEDFMNKGLLLLLSHCSWQKHDTWWITGSLKWKMIPKNNNTWTSNITPKKGLILWPWIMLLPWSPHWPTLQWTPSQRQKRFFSCCAHLLQLCKARNKPGTIWLSNLFLFLCNAMPVLSSNCYSLMEKLFHYQAFLPKGVWALKLSH